MDLLPPKGVRQRERLNRIFLAVKTILRLVSYKEQNRFQANNSSLLATSAERNPARTSFHNFSGEEIKASILPSHHLNCPMDELIATGEAAFEFIRNAEMDVDMKNAFYQLEKQFSFYKNLCQLVN